MGQLFNKSYDELREDFVRARFAEPAIFGREDIEEWLEGQRDELRNEVDLDSWRNDGFERYLLNTWGDDLSSETSEAMTNLLREHVTPSTNRPDWADENHRVQEFSELTEFLRHSGHTVFYRTVAGELLDELWTVILMGSKTRGLVGPLGQGAEIILMRFINILDILDFLHEEIRGGRPKAEKALEFLLSQYMSAIAGVRQAAQRDFDEAVAVSADGTKIVKAKWVVIMGNAPSGDRVFTADLFHGQKILLNEELRAPKSHFRNPWNAKDHRVEAFFQSFVKRSAPAYSNLTAESRYKPAQQLVKCDDGCILFVRADDCPSPLPDGGREIRV